MANSTNVKDAGLPQDARRLITAAAIAKANDAGLQEDLSRLDRIKSLPSIVTWNFTPRFTKIAFAIWQKYHDCYLCFYSYDDLGNKPKPSHCIEILLSLDLRINKFLISHDISVPSPYESVKEQRKSNEVVQEIKVEYKRQSKQDIKIDKAYRTRIDDDSTEKINRFISQCRFCSAQAHLMVTALKNVERHMDKTTGIFVNDLSTGPAGQYNRLYQCADIAASHLAGKENDWRWSSRPVMLG